MAEPGETTSVALPAAPVPTVMDNYTNHAAIEADDTVDNDADSAYGTENAASSMASISSSILKYRQENGRTYHAYKVRQVSFFCVIS